MNGMSPSEVEYLYFLSDLTTLLIKYKPELMTSQRDVVESKISQTCTNSNCRLSRINLDSGKTRNYIYAT